MGHKIYSNENEVEGVRIRVEYDESAESPRTAWDNVAAFWSDGMHRRYNFHEDAADEVLARIKAAMPVPDELLEDGSEDPAPVARGQHRHGLRAGVHGRCDIG